METPSENPGYAPGSCEAEMMIKLTVQIIEGSMCVALCIDLYMCVGVWV